MAALCESYWYPLYAYIRRRGFDTYQAEDLTQEFFLRLLAPQYLAGVDRQKGKFRSFLLTALKHFLANEWDRAQAQKRGGGHVVIPLDALSAETRYRREPAHELTPERLFERQWAIAVLERVLARLQAESEKLDGKSTVFERLKQFLTADSDKDAEKEPGPICAKHRAPAEGWSGRSDKLDLAPVPQPKGTYAAVALELGMTEGAVKVAVHRLRRRYRELLREEIAQTVQTPDEIDDEIRYLLSCL